MLRCSKCGEELAENCDSSSKGSTSRGAISNAPPVPPLVELQKQSLQWQLKFKVFRSTWTSWESLFHEAAEFANQLGPDRVVSISHSEDRSDGVLAVWYWSNGLEAE